MCPTESIPSPEATEMYAVRTRIKHLGRLGLLLIATSPIACKAPPLVEGTIPPESFSSQVEWDRYSLGPGDVVRVSVFQHPEFSTSDIGQRIDGQGNLSLPLIGPIPIGGLQQEQARALIQQELATYIQEPSANLSVIDYGARRVYVFGQVRDPGSFILDRPINALQALTLAGGFMPGADREQVALMRASSGEFEVAFFNAQTPDTNGLVGVLPDDFLFVRQSGAGRFSDQALPVLQALAPVIGAMTNALVVADALDD